MSWSITKSAQNYDIYTHTAISANGLNSTDAIDIGPFGGLSVQIVHAGLADTATWELQSTNDGTNFDSIAGTSTVTSGAAGSATKVISPAPFRSIRVKITEIDGAAASTLTAIMVGTKYDR